MLSVKGRNKCIHKRLEVYLLRVSGENQIKMVWPYVIGIKCSFYESLSFLWMIWTIGRLKGVMNVATQRGKIILLRR